MWPFEQATLHEGDTGPGLLPARWLKPAFMAVAVVGMLALWLQGFATWPLMILALATLLLARQLVLDLCHETLLDIYNAPLLLLGLLWATLYGVGWQQSLLGGVIAFGVSVGLGWVLGRVKPGISGLGGGDIKLLTVMGVWLGPVGLLLAFILANFINLAVALGFNRPSMPQGPGLIVALWVSMVWPSLLLNLFLKLVERI